MAMQRVRRIAMTTAVLALVGVIAAGCGKSGNDDDGDSSTSSAKDGVEVGLVTDIGGLNDRSFNAQANKGFEQAKEELGSTGSVIESKSDSDYSKNLGSQVTNGSDLVIGIGFLMGDAVKEAASKAPDTKFAIVDFSYADEQGAWGATDNVAGILFKEQEAGYLAGVLAGKAEMEGELEGLNEQHVVSAVGGQEIPPVVKFIAGFEAGVKSQCTDCQVLVDYSQDFVDQTKCQDRANAQIAKGSDIVFQVAGGCGLGALDAAKTKGVWGIGVDADQAYLGVAHPHERREARGRGRVHHDRARGGRRLPRWRGDRLRPGRGRGRHRRDRRARAAVPGRRGRPRARGSRAAT